MKKEQVVPILKERGWHIITKNAYRNTKAKIEVWCHGARNGSYSYLQAKKMEGIK
jgi:hypothetical protein